MKKNYIKDDTIITDIQEIVEQQPLSKFFGIFTFFCIRTNFKYFVTFAHR